MYDLTGSAWDVGLVGLVRFLPALLLAIPAGHRVDRVDRRGCSWQACCCKPASAVRRRIGHWMFAAVAVYGVAILAFALSTVFLESLIALAVSGAADMVSVVIRETLLQIETPDELRGPVSAVNATFIGASNRLVEFRAGALAAWLGPAGSVVPGPVGTLSVVALWMRLFPGLLRRDRLAP